MRGPDRAGPRAGARPSDVFHDLVHVAEEDHGIVVNTNHAPVMGGGVDLEGLGGHVAAEIFGDLAHLEDQLALAVDPDGRRIVGGRDTGVVLFHELGDGPCLDAVVHGDAALVRNLTRAQVDVLHRLEDVLPGRVTRYV